MAKAKAIRILIVDDHRIVREGLRTLLRDEPLIEVVGETGTAQGAVAMAEKLVPDIVLMDVALSDRNGVEAASEIRNRKIPAKVVLLTSAVGNRLHLQKAIDAGVMGYLLKDVSKSELLHSIKQAVKGSPVFHPSVQEQLLRRAEDRPLAHEALTPRELSILCELARGKSNKAIAYDLNLTEGTVKGYVSAVLSKLSVADRTQAALYAVRHGLAEE